MPLTNITFTTTFDRTTGTMQFVDTTNYASQGYPAFSPLVQQRGYLKVTYNTGGGDIVVYNNYPVAPPPYPAVPDSFSQGGPVVFTTTNINIPLTSAGLPIPAQYKVEYFVAIFFGLNVDTETATNIYNYNLTDPSICIQSVVNCNESAVQSTDDTDYSIPNGVVTSIVRDHTLYPPVTSGAAVLGPLNQITLLYTPIYTTTWTAEVISTVTYTMNDGLIVIVELTGIKEFQVVCDTNLSKIICCLINLQKEYEALLCKNPVKAEMFKQTKLDPSLQHLSLFLAAQSAGNQSKMDCEYAALIKASGCGGDCGCGDSTPVLVQPAGAGFSYTLQSSTGNIVVTQTVVGNTINWNINIAPAILAAINAASNTVVSTTTPNFLTVTQVGAAPNLNYQVDYNPNEIEKLLIIDPNLNIGLDYLEFTDTNIVNEGTLINPVGSQSVVLGTDNTGAPISPNNAGNLALFVLGALTNPGTTPFTASANVMRSNDTLVATSIKNIEAEVFYVDDILGDVYVRLYNPQNGQVYTLADLKNGTWDKIYIKFNLKA